MYHVMVHPEIHFSEWADNDMLYKSDGFHPLTKNVSEVSIPQY